MVCRVHPRHRTEERPIAQHRYLAEDGYLAEEIIRSDGPRALLKSAAHRSSRMRDCAGLPLHGGGPIDPPDPDLRTSWCRCANLSGDEDGLKMIKPHGQSRLIRAV